MEKTNELIITLNGKKVRVTKGCTVDDLMDLTETYPEDKWNRIKKELQHCYKTLYNGQRKFVNNEEEGLLKKLMNKC